eukprot:212262_1
MATFLSILSAFLINRINAQAGAGCALSTCAQPGQVRIDAIFNQNGDFIGGCNCGCDPGLSDPASPNYCPEPNVINFNSRTLTGDCSCQCASTSVTPQSCLFPSVYDPKTCGCRCPSFAPDPSSCLAPTEFNPQLCQCACEIGSIGGPCVSKGNPIPGSQVKSDCSCDTTHVACPGNQHADSVTGECICPTVSPTGAYYPSCNLPLIQDPLTCDCITTTTTLPPVGPIEVTCTDSGPCSCPFGTQGTCTINCDGGTDSCKDGLIECNNNGHACVVNCLSDSACAGATSIIGPVGSALTVNCIGAKSCEGAVNFDGDKGTDLTVACEGDFACKGGVSFNFGMGIGSIACNGLPDACQGGAEFVLQPNAEITPGVAFSCTGTNCPGNAPVAFSNAHLPTIPITAVPDPSIGTNPHVGGSGLGQLPVPQTPGGNVINNGNNPLPVVLPDEIVVCEGVGATCGCSGQRSCTIRCENEHCKEATLNCADGFDCNIVCMEVSCQIGIVNGPVNGNLDVKCLGESACVNTQFNAHEAVDVTYTCEGKDACKGATHLACGTGICDVQCTGEASCDSASIDPVTAVSFTCFGHDADCPPNYTPPPIAVPTPSPTQFVPCSQYGPCPCEHMQCFQVRDPADNCQCSCPMRVLLMEAQGHPQICGVDATHQIYHPHSCSCDCQPNAYPQGGCLYGQSFNQNTCQCECPGGNTCPGSALMNLETCQCQCPLHSPTASDCSAIGKVLRNCMCDCPIQCAGEGQIQSPETCTCGCPSNTPSAHQCESGIVDYLACECAAPIPSTFCCHTSTPNFKPWQGRCWDEQTEESCFAEPNGRCTWDPNNCHPNPPANSLNPGIPCIMRDMSCNQNADCCSEVCKIDGACR